MNVESASNLHDCVKLMRLAKAGKKNGYLQLEFNIITMHGDYTEIVQDGIMYRIAECNNAEEFAGHELYVCVSYTTFYESSAYVYDEETGVISRNEEYEGVNALFELPLDINTEDPDAVNE